MTLSYEKQFHFSDGSHVATLEKLREKIENLHYEEFYNHVNADKNDFANWVRYVLVNAKLATDLEKVTSIVETVEVLNDYLHPLEPRDLDDIQSRIEQDHDIDPMEVYNVPTTSPELPKSTDFADFSVIEENIQEPLKPELPPALSTHEHKMHVLKEFMYGLFLGLVVGVILGGMLAG